VEKEKNLSKKKKKKKIMIKIEMMTIMIKEHIYQQSIKID
jgi:hypothetical protein